MTSRRAPEFDDRRRSRGDSGFTLIELLIALTLFGLLSVALVGGLRFGTRVWERGHEQSAAFAEIEAVHGLLREQLQQARPVPEITREQGQVRGFVGSPDRIEFFAPLPQHVGLGGLYRFVLQAVEEGQSGSLILSWRLHRADGGRSADGDDVSRRILLDGIKELRVRYYGAFESDEDPDWHDDWQLGGPVPNLIAIDLALPSDDARHWPEFVVAPIAAQDIAAP